MSSTPSGAQLKTVQNGNLPSSLSAPGLDLPTNGVYNASVKDPSQIKSPQLPFGENVAVATSATAVS